MKRLLSGLTAACVILTASFCQAGSFSSVIFDISGAHFERLDGAVWVDIGAADLIDPGAATTGSANAMFGGPGMSTSTGFGGGPDTVNAWEGSDLGDNTMFGGPVVAGTPGANGDSNGSGSLIIQPPGADVSVGGVVDGGIGEGFGDVGTSGSFSVLTSGMYRLAFDAEIAWSMIDMGTENATGETEFAATLNGGDVTAGSVLSALNLTFTSADGTGTTGTLSLATDAVQLVTGQTHEFTISQSARATISTIPEPTSALVALGLCSVGFVRRRRA